jgi:hypothetical protein
MHSHPSVKTGTIAWAGLFIAGLLLYVQAQSGKPAEARGPLGADSVGPVLRQKEPDHRRILTGTTSDSVELKSQLVVFPNAQVAFICGPQLKAGSPLNPSPWFDTTAWRMGITLGNRTSRVPPFGPMTFNSYTGRWENVIAGRVSVNSSGLIVTGVGTAFTRDVDPAGSAPNFNGHLRIRDALGVERAVEVRSVESDTRLTLKAPWLFGSTSDTVADTYYQQVGYNANTESYYSDNYYDLALVQYINYYRTGDTRFLTYARKAADAWWHSQLIGDGTVTDGPNHLPPRSMAFAGLMLRAMDGRPEMWDYLERETRASFDNWVYVRKNDGLLYYDLREDGYAQLYAVLLAKVLPDRYPLYGNGTLKASSGTASNGAAKRATYLSQAEDAAVNFFGRLQHPDGSWRWDANTSSDPNNQYRNVEQPFMSGLYLESLTLLHQLTSRREIKAKLVEQLTKSVTHLYKDAYERSVVSDFPKQRWRAVVYFWGGGTMTHPGLYNPPQPRLQSRNQEGGVPGARHLNSTIHHAFGYAYYVTGDPTYKEMGDEMFDASYGDQVDGIHCLADSGKGKDYAMNFRASGRYLVWRLAGSRDENGSSARRTGTPNTTIATTRQDSQRNPEKLVSDCLTFARGLADSLADKDQIKALIVQIENSQLALKADKRSSIAPGLLGELEAALANARTALSIAESGSYDSARLRVGWSAAKLKRAADMLRNKSHRVP